MLAVILFNFFLFISYGSVLNNGFLDLVSDVYTSNDEHVWLTFISNKLKKLKIGIIAAFESLDSALYKFKTCEKSRTFD